MSLKQKLLSIPAVKAANRWRHQRFSPPEYRGEVRITVPDPLPDPAVGGDLMAEVSILNTGRLPWVPGGGVSLVLLLVGPKGPLLERHERRLDAPEAVTVAPGESWNLAPFPLRRWRRHPGVTVRAEVLFPPTDSIAGGCHAETILASRMEGPSVELDFWNTFLEKAARSAAARGEVVEFPLRVLNTGTEEIGGDGDFVSWHLYDAGLELTHWDGPRLPVGRVLAPGEWRNLLVRIDPAALPARGEFVLRFDVVREGGWWAVNLPVPADLAIRFHWEGHQDETSLEYTPEAPQAARHPSELSFPADLPIKTVVHEIDGGEFARFEGWIAPWVEQREAVLAAIPGVEAWGVIKPTREKLLEYYLSTVLLKPRAGWTLLDAASCTSLFPNFFAEACLAERVIRQDLLYEDGVRSLEFPSPSRVVSAFCREGVWEEPDGAVAVDGPVRLTCVGSDACVIPMSDGCIDAITLHCSLEHFEGDADSWFVREAMRLLRPGGQLLIIPFYCGGESAELYHPEYAPGCRFHRYYTPETFRRRVLDAIPCRWSATLYQFPNARVIDPGFYCDLAMVIRRG